MSAASRLPFFALCALLLLVAASGPRGAFAQVSGTAGASSGGAGAAVAGGALGAVSGAVLGMSGSMIPCSQTEAGPQCVRLASVAGGVVGMASGIVIGANDQQWVEDHLLTAGIGAAVGLGMSFIAAPKIERFGWQDAAAIGLFGAAIGAAPRGALIGLGAGAIAGLIVWQTVPEARGPDAVALGLAGLTLGVLAEWVIAAGDAGADDGAAITLSIPLVF